MVAGDVADRRPVRPAPRRCRPRRASRFGRVMEQRVPAALALQHQREGGVAADGDPAIWSIWTATLSGMVSVPEDRVIRARVGRHYHATPVGVEAPRPGGGAGAAGRSPEVEAELEAGGGGMGSQPEATPRGRCGAAPRGRLPRAAAASLGRRFTSTKATVAPAANDEVDLADRRLVAAGKDAVALEAEPERGNRLRRAGRVRSAARRSRSGGRSTLAVTVPVLERQRRPVEVPPLQPGERGRLLGGVLDRARS